MIEQIGVVILIMLRSLAFACLRVSAAAAAAAGAVTYWFNNSLRSSTSIQRLAARWNSLGAGESENVSAQAARLPVWLNHEQEEEEKKNKIARENII